MYADVSVGRNSLYTYQVISTQVIIPFSHRGIFMCTILGCLSSNVCEELGSNTPR